MSHFRLLFVFLSTLSLALLSQCLGQTSSSSSSSSFSSSSLVPFFPLDFRADITITSNLLPHDLPYPPRLKKLSILYSYSLRSATVTIHQGYEAGTTYVRLYDDEHKTEYQYVQGGGSSSGGGGVLPASCRRSYLGTRMPLPTIPKAVHVGTETLASVGGGGGTTSVTANHFVRDEGHSRVHMYFDVASGLPLRLLHEDVEEGSGVATATMTYDFADVQLLSDEQLSAMTLPQKQQQQQQQQDGKNPWQLPGGFTHETCERHVGGFPYLHLFHYYLRV